MKRTDSCSRSRLPRAGPAPGLKVTGGGEVRGYEGGGDENDGGAGEDIVFMNVAGATGMGGAARVSPVGGRRAESSGGGDEKGDGDRDGDDATGRRSSRGGSRGGSRGMATELRRVTGVLSQVSRRGGAQAASQPVPRMLLRCRRRGGDSPLC